MIVPMKKATLFALLQDRQKILLALQRCGEWMVIEPEAGRTDENLDKAEQDTQRIGASIKFLSAQEKKKTMPFAPRPSVRFDQLTGIDEKSVALARETERLIETLQSLHAESASLTAQAQQLEPWKGLDLPIEKIRSTKFARFAVGNVAAQGAQALAEATTASGAQAQLLGTSPEGVAMFVAYHVSSEESVREALKSGGFADVVLPRVSGTPAQAIEVIRSRIDGIAGQIAEVQARAAKLSEQKVELQTLYESAKAERDRRAAAFTQSRCTFCLQGWVRADRVKDVEQAVSSTCQAYDLSFADPAQGDYPPTVLQNAPAVQPFEAVTDLYSRPHPFGFDPNSVLAVFYFIFFGMMMSDAGYGLVITALLLAFQSFAKPKGNFGKLVGVLLFGSISTILWGFAFGGLFGISIQPLLFNPMQEPIKMLLLCYALGIVHLFSGMVIKMVLNFKAGDWKAAIFDQLSWMLLIIGCMMLALPQTSAVGKWLAIYGAGSILLMAGRENKNFIKRIFGGLMSLYGITSYLSDILSYSRLFALGLATGVIAMVINTIGKMLMAGQGIMGAIGFVVAIVIFAGGHVFNIAINMLGSFVHTARLQYIEFFGKFYESGGKEFKPLAIRPKYMDVLR